MKICVFSTKYSYTWLQNIQQLEIDNVEFDVIFYTDLQHLTEVFRENHSKYPAVLFSGQIPYLHIKKNCPTEFAAMPSQFIDITERDLYFTLTKIQYENPGFRFTDALIDFLYEENNYLSLKEWLPEDEFPYILSESIQVFGEPNAYELVAKRHLDLLDEGKVKFCFTRLTNLYMYFSHVDVKPILVTPSLKSMEAAVQKLLKEIEVYSLMKSQVVCGHLEFSFAENDFSENEYRQVALYKAILDFNRKFGYSLLIYRSSLHNEIITNYSDYIRITSDETKCSLATFLREQLPFKVKIGWGIGKTLTIAQSQAEKASSYCQKPFTESYRINKENKLLGPLDGTNISTIAEQAHSFLEEIAKKTNISIFQLEKLYDMMRSCDKDKFTAEEVSLHLSVSTRTGNRLLKKLTEYSYATIIETLATPTGKGRPKNLFHLHLDEIDNKS
ncbi:hypothetical protein MKY51_03305 [Solibacillus sp. FSL R5-0691]|uniref:hypothetical protein n=1 Tax=Solibacillus sp. FSL R5-0691 TaxID=2921653 RepID=UPI0030CF1133